MKKLAAFSLLGLGFSVPGEILNQILARHNIRAFGSTMISYTVLLFLGFFVEKGIGAMLPRPKARLVYYLLFGSLGLMVEWLLLGNAPVLEPFQVITQPGMFTFWGTMLLGPCILLEPDFPALKWSFLRFFLLYSLLYLGVALVLPKEKGGIFIAFVIFAAGSAALNWFYWKYYKHLAAG
jgi:hypothetical protein